MIKAKTTDGDLIFGLSAENIKRLQKGMPIKINLKDLGLEDRTIVILYGESEQSIAKDLSQFFTPKTIIHSQ